MKIKIDLQTEIIFDVDKKYNLIELGIIHEWEDSAYVYLNEEKAKEIIKGLNLFIEKLKNN